jgi:heme exporter protein CcmD
MTEFFSMGGYAAYVWSSFGVSLVALILLYWRTRIALSKATERARRFIQAAPGETA